MRLPDWLPEPLQRFLKFGMISTLGTIIDLVIVLSLTYVVRMPEWQALALSMLVSASVVYMGHELLTFNDAKTKGLRKGRWLTFALTTVVIYGFRVAVFTLLAALGLPRLVALVLALVSSIIVNFTVSRFAIFKPGRD